MHFAPVRGFRECGRSEFAQPQQPASPARLAPVAAIGAAPIQQPASPDGSRAAGPAMPIRGLYRHEFVRDLKGEDEFQAGIDPCHEIVRHTPNALREQSLVCG